MRALKKCESPSGWSRPEVLSFQLSQKELARIDRAKSPEQELRTIYLERKRASIGQRAADSEGERL